MAPRKTISAAAADALPGSEIFEVLGQRLKDLRGLHGMTQVDLARALGVGQTALSHVEDGRDMRISTLLQYVRALGGTLSLTADFESGVRHELLPRGGQSEGAGELGRDSSDQLVLPGFVATAVSSARDIVFSIKPRYAEQILSGQKTVELRRRFSPDVSAGGRAWIYSTTPMRALTGAATISAIQRMPVGDIWRRHKDSACILKQDFDNYFSGTNTGYAISLAAPRLLTKPLALSELRERFGFEPPQSYQYASPQISGLIYDGWAEAPN